MNLSFHSITKTTSWKYYVMVNAVLFTHLVSAQSPGGVSGGLSLWTKADVTVFINGGVTACADGQTVQQWNNSQGVGLHLTQPAANKRPTYYATNASRLFNYNPTIAFDPTGFDASGDRLELTTVGTNLFHNDKLTVFMVEHIPNTTNVQVFFKWQDSPAGPNRVGFETNAGNLRFDQLSTNNVNNPALSVNNIHRVIMGLSARGGNETTAYGAGQAAGTRVRVDGKEGTTLNSNSNSNDFSLTKQLAIGANNNEEPTNYYSLIDISEVIIYKEALVANDRNRVDTYLGIKYGLSLYHDYLSSASTTVWSRATNAAYNYGIIGIARDDASDLLQKQSHSMSRLNDAVPERDIVTIYINALALNNQSNTGTFAAGDKSFFLVGSNRATALGTVTTENAPTVVKTLNREWLSQQSNFSNSDVSVEFDLNTAAAVFAGPVCQKPILLMDTDGNFSNATLVPDSVSGLVRTGNVIKVTLSAAMFQAMPYFTIGFVNKDDTASSTFTDPKCFGSSDGSVAVNLPTGGAAPYTYSINGGAYQVSNSFTGLPAGTYYPTAKDNNGCFFRDTLILTNPADITITGDFTEPSCYGFTNGKAFVKTLTDTVAPVTYAWTNGGTTDTVTVGAGNWKVVITDNNGCKDSVTVNVTQPAKLDIDTVVTPASCPLVNNGKIVTTATGGTSPYTYNKNTGAYAGGGTFSSLATGTYTIRVKDAKGCLDSAIVFVAAGPTPTVIAPNDTLICPGSTLTLSGSGTPGVTYTWDNGVSNGVSFTVSATKKYKVTGTDANGCKDTDSTQVTLASVPNATINPAPSPICSDTGDVQLTSQNGGGTWRGTGISDPANGIFNPVLSGSGSFDVIYEIVNTCSDDDTIKVVVTPRKNATINPAGPFCANAGIQQLTAVQPGGAWSGTAVNAAGQFDPAAAGTGNHVITYSLGGTCPDSKSITISVNTSFNAQITPGGPYCVNGATVQLQSVTPGATWSGPGITDASIGTFDPAIAGVGTHTITHTIAGSCGSVDTENFTVLPRDTVRIQPPNDSICYNAPIMNLGADKSGGVWSGAVNGNGDFDPSGKQPGSYKVYYTYSPNCAYTDSAVITIPDTLFASMASVWVSCFGDMNGTLTAVASGGILPYSYSWTGYPGTGASLSGLGKGIYTVGVTDGLGCFFSVSAAVMEPSAVVIPSNNVVVVNDSCFGAQKGAVTLSASGGTPDPNTGIYIYSINPVVGSPNAGLNGFDNIGAGNYTLTATDYNGCKTTYVITVTQPPKLLVYGSTVSDFCSQGIGSCRVDSTKGGTSPYTYKWSNGSQGVSNPNLAAGTYTVVVTDQMNCTDSSQLPVGNIPALVVTAAPVTTTCFGGNDGAVSVSVTGANGSTTTTWSDGLLPNQTARSNFKSGTYWVEVTDSQNCKNRDTFFIPEPTDIFMVPVSGGLVCYGIPYTGVYNATGGNGAPYSFFQNNVPVPANYSLPNTGTYSVFSRDQRGCFSDTISFTLFKNPDIQAGVFADQTVCRGDVAQFSLTASGGNGNYLYSFDGQSPVGMGIKNYQTGKWSVNPQLVQVVITDGCSKPDTAVAELKLHPDTIATLDLNPNPAKGCYPLDVTYVLSTNLTVFSLDPGDGTQLPQAASFNYTFNRPGTYYPKISGKTAQGCIMNKTFNTPIAVSGYPEPDFDWEPFHPTILDNKVQFTNFTSGGADKFDWYIMDSLLTDTILYSQDISPGVFLPAVATTYAVLLKAQVSSSTCADTLLKYLTVEEEMLVYVPNAFTPNHDGYNELFRPSLYYVEPADYRFEIYNRWGQRIFVTNSLDGGWDGTFEGVPARNDVYTYIIRYRKAASSTKKKLLGKFTLIR